MLSTFLASYNFAGRQVSLTELEKKCFVISPIGEEGGDIRRSSGQIFEYAIKPAVVDQGYETVSIEMEVRIGFYPFN